MMFCFVFLNRVQDEEENEMRVSMIAESVGDGDEEVNSSHDVLKTHVGLKLLNSKQIIRLCECTPSVKTKHAFLEVLIPRCTDPSEGGAAIVDMFRFTADRERTSEALKVKDIYLPSTLCFLFMFLFFESLLHMHLK
jgi:hypothetical protein